MTKKKNKALALALAACMSFGTLGAFGGLTAREAFTASALDETSTATYPFETGATAFKNAPTFTQTSTESTDKWEYVEVTFGKTVDLSAATYIAVQIKMEKGDPGLTIGLIENADRYKVVSADNGDDASKRAPVYFQSEDGSVKRIGIRYDSVNMGANACGTLYLPMNSMGWQWNNSNSDLTKVKSLYYTANIQFNRDYALTIGEIGYYTGDPAEGAPLTKIIDLSQGELPKSRYFMDTLGTSISFPSDKAMPKIPYAFEEGTDAFKNTVEWKPTAKDETLTVAFDEATVDLSEATHLLVQYYSAKSPRLQYTLSDGTNASSLKNGGRVFFMGMGANFSDLYVAANASGASFGENKGRLLMGMIVIPIAENLAGHVDLTKVSSLQIKATGATEVVIGGVASYKGERGDGSYEGGESAMLLNLAASKFAKFTASKEGTLEEIQAKPVSNTMYGTSETVTEDLNFNGKESSYVGEWSGEQTQQEANKIFIGGSYGKIEMTEDSYGNDAIQVTATGVRGDGYTATQNLLPNGVCWAGMKGVSFWARNDSDIEVAFNLEVECTAVVTKSNGNKQVASDRFNIQQGNRFVLYDLNTGKTTIYMTRPTVTLPVGFEGWVFIPFTAFSRADWSSNGVTAEQFMGENSYVNFFAFSIEAAKNQNKPFSVNSIGAYSETPLFESVYADANGKTAPELLGLNNKEEN